MRQFARLSFLLFGVLLQKAMPQTAAEPPKLITKTEAVSIAFAQNQTIRAQRLNIDQSKASEITALLKPNPNFTTIVDTIPIFSPSTIRFSTQIYSENLSYTVERGGKREKRGVVAKDNTEVTALTTTDNERTLRFSVVQGFINMLLAKSVLDLAKDDLANFSQSLELNHARLVAGDLSEGDYIKLELQKLQFEQDVSGAQLNLAQARAALRQQLGYQSVAEDFDVVGTLLHNKQPVTLDELQKLALANRPDLQSAHASVKLAADTVALAYGNRAKDWTLGRRLNQSKRRDQWRRSLVLDRRADSRPQSGRDCAQPGGSAAIGGTGSSHPGRSVDGRGERVRRPAQQ